MKGKTYIYIYNKFVETSLDFENLLKLWDQGILKPLEAVKPIVEQMLGSIKRANKHAILLRPENKIVVIEYIVETEKGGVSLKIIHAENPSETLKNYDEAKKLGKVQLRTIYEGNYLKMIQATVRANFYNVRAIKELEEVEKEIVNLINDVIDYWPRGLPTNKFTNLAIRSAFLFSLLHVVWPLSNGILVDLLVGNLPACFMQLRLIIETAAKALTTDYEYRFQGVSLHGVEELEKYLQRKNISMSKFYREIFSRVVGKEMGRNTLCLWSKLSENWVHFRGITRRIRKRIEEEKGIPPSYVLVLPTELDEGDIKDIKELTKRVAETRKLLQVFFKIWEKLVNEHYFLGHLSS